MTTKNKVFVVFWIILAIVFTCGLSVISDMHNIDKMAVAARSRDMKTGECFDQAMFFGGQVCVERDIKNKEKAIFYRVSNDKYSIIKADFNKSRIIGEYVGSRSVQFFKGFAFGKKKVSGHDGEDNE